MEYTLFLFVGVNDGFLKSARRHFHAIAFFFMNVLGIAFGTFIRGLWGVSCKP